MMLLLLYPFIILSSLILSILMILLIIIPHIRIYENTSPLLLLIRMLPSPPLMVMGLGLLNDMGDSVSLLFYFARFSYLLLSNSSLPLLFLYQLALLTPSNSPLSPLLLYSCLAIPYSLTTPLALPVSIHIFL